MLKVALAIIATLGASAASAQELRDLCADRPGLGTPPCVVDKGHLQVELGLGDWTLDRQPDTRTDTIVAGDMLLRLGVTQTTEVRLNWQAYGHVRERDRTSGAISRMSGVGDVTIGILQSLKNPDGDGFSIGLLPQVTLPAGGKAIGAGTWGAQLIVPVTFDLSDLFTVEVNGDVEAAPNESRHGRHLAYGSVVGLITKLSEQVEVTTEIGVERDRDPEERTTTVLAALSLDYKPTKRIQLDVQANAGLNRDSPDVEILFGISRKF